MARNRTLERKRGIRTSEFIFHDNKGQEWLVEKRWTKLEGPVL